MLCLAMLALVNFTACSDDEEESGSSGGTINGDRNLKTVYADYGGGDKWYDFSGAVWDGGKVTSFCQGETANDVENRMSITYSSNKAYISDGGDNHKITLNGNGYAEEADFYGETYSYTYNADGQMTSWRGDEGFCTISYNSDGDILSVNSDYYDGVLFDYTNADVTKPIDNKGGVMLMSEWGIMEDWEYFYWFGIYGKSTKHLPVKVGDNTFDWTLDSQGYPISCKVYDAEYDESFTYHFEWE